LLAGCGAPVAQVSLRWQPALVEEAGIRFDAIAGREIVRGHVENDVDYVMQPVAATHGVQLALGIDHGPGATFDRSRYGGTGVRFGPEDTVTVCGAPVRRFVVERPAGPPGGFALGEDGEHTHLEQTPAMTDIIVTFVHRGRHVLASWDVESSHRAELRAAEEHFFASLRCVP
jgi:hypothetical protein